MFWTQRQARRKEREFLFDFQKSEQLDIDEEFHRYGSGEIKLKNARVSDEYLRMAWGNDYEFPICRSDKFVLSGSSVRFRLNCIHRLRGVKVGKTIVEKRGVISEFSERSKRNMVKATRESQDQYRYFATLTYPNEYPIYGRVFKNHLRRFLQELRRYWARKGVPKIETGLFWFLEFQKRGAPHYHLFTAAFIPKKWLSWCWFRIVGSKDERHLRAGTNVERLRAGRNGVVSYALKYARKSDQKDVPSFISNVGRFWGIKYERRPMAANTELVHFEGYKLDPNGLFNSILKAIEYQFHNPNFKGWLDDDGMAGCIYFDINADMSLWRDMFDLINNQPAVRLLN